MKYTTAKEQEKERREQKMAGLLIKLYNLLSVTDTAPLPLSGYHIAWIIFVAIITVTLIILFSDADERETRKIIASAWIIMLTMELLKQLISCMTVSGNQITWRYNFDIFPYQLCSTPLYILPIAAFMKDGHKRNTAIVFLSTFSLIGGLTIFIIPNSVLSGHKFVDFQSMLHHGIQIFIGIYLTVRYRTLLTVKNFQKAIYAFLIMTSIAILLNVIFMNAFSASVNLFFVSPYVRYIPPLLEGLGLEKLPYPIYLFGYLSLFIAIAYILMEIFSFLTKRSFS